MAIEFGTVYAGKLHLAADAETTAAAHACTIDHDGVHGNNGLDAVFFGELAYKLHHDEGPDGDHFVILVAGLDKRLERIGDQAEDIAEIIQFLAGRSAENDDLLREMARSTIHMVTESVDAYVQRDTMLAETVIAEDDVVDNAFDEVKRRLIDKIAAHPEDGEYALDLLMIAKYFERIGDHATNIAEWVIFSVTGVHKEG